MYRTIILTKKKTAASWVCRRTLLSRALVYAKYHRVCMLSLLCSEWEEVGHTQIKHRQAQNAAAVYSIRKNQKKNVALTQLWTSHYELPTRLGIRNEQSVVALAYSLCAASQRVRSLSTARLNTLRCVHLQPINVVISDGSHPGRPEAGDQKLEISAPSSQFPALQTDTLSWGMLRT